MNTRKIKVKLVDRPATLLCSFFGTLLGKRRADRDGKNIWGFMLRYTDKVYIAQEGVEGENQVVAIEQSFRQT